MISAARNSAVICRLLLAAGADADLLDPGGRSARDIAQAAGSHEAAEVIDAACTRETPRPHGFSQREPSSIVAGKEEATIKDRARLRQSSPFPQVDSACATHAHSGVESEPSNQADSIEFDLTGWAVDEDGPAPTGNPTVFIAALEIQSAITAHHPIDTSVEWDDIEGFLPERATPIPHSNDAEAREQLRGILLRAFREGSVPLAAIEELTHGDGDTPNFEATALLEMIINDLGAETDERIELQTPQISFEVYISPEETPDETEAIDEALALVDEFSSRRNDPLRIYLREIQYEPLLSAQAEVDLGKGMEDSVEKALDALILWQAGMAAVLASAKQVSLGARPLRWMSSGRLADLPDVDSDGSAGVDIDFDAHPNLSAEVGSDDDVADFTSSLEFKQTTDELAAFRANAEILSTLWVNTSQHQVKGGACRKALASLGLSRGFLVALANLDVDTDSEAARVYISAMKAYQVARDRMTVANLKLVNSIAKKYPFSRQPIDDLLQEGNIGVMKAVDRFDWRRGFKFSTYATWWIRQNIGRFVADKSKTIRLPVHVYEKTQRIAQETRAYELAYAREPTVEEIADLVGLPPEKIDALRLASTDPLSIHDIDRLDDQISADTKDRCVVDDPGSIVDVSYRIRVVDRLLSILNDREAMVIRMRFGIDVHDPMTLEEIGGRLNVTRERIRQIEAKALTKLQQPWRLAQLYRELNGLPLPVEYTATVSRPVHHIEED
jgi:RNA polymerase primary sigma factor